MARKPADPTSDLALDAVMTPITTLTPHPRNYRTHPDDQIEHLMASIIEYGFYRNVVACTDGTILAGHGIVLAAERLELREVPVVYLALDPLEPRALKVLALDNFVSHLAEDDDRMLAEMLKEIALAEGLLGTGFDELSLAAFAMVTRSGDEIANADAAAEWIGMPEFTGSSQGPQLVIEFDDDDHRQRFVDAVDGLMITYKKGVGGESAGRLWSCRWIEDPAERDRQDPGSLLFEG